MTPQPNPDPPEAMKPTPANPENVPLDKIPAGWRLLYEGEYRSNLPTRLWEGSDCVDSFSDQILMWPDERIANYTYITPDLPDNGQPWHAHKPGDPAPVAADVKVDCICRNGLIGTWNSHRVAWSKFPSTPQDEILFYRLHEPAIKTTFEAHGHTWFKHTPGDPMPCDGEAEVHVVFEDISPGDYPRKAIRWAWDKLTRYNTIVGWRYAHPELYTPPTQIAEPTVKPEDPVNLPTHYRSHPSGVECIEVTEHMNFCLGNAVKYLWRAGLKSSDTHLEDLRKARWYLDREITRIEKQQQP